MLSIMYRGKHLPEVCEFMDCGKKKAYGQNIGIYVEALNEAQAFSIKLRLVALRKHRLLQYLSSGWKIRTYDVRLSDASLPKT